MNGKKPTVISLFAGCGGSTLGYKQAGYKELLAVDFDNYCIEIFEMNFPDIPIWKRDIKEITGKEIMEFCKIKDGTLDVLDSSPPCQGFSRSGKKIVVDPRNEMGFEIARLVGKMKPKVFLMENVCGMIEGEVRGLFKMIFTDLKSRGYRVMARIMNSKYYGVPQSRDRLIFIGVRNDFNIEPTFPRHETRPISCGSVIGDVDNDGEKMMTYSGKWKNLLPTLREGRGLEDISGGYGYNLRRIHHLKPSNTITAHMNLLHYNEDRYLTIKELKMLASFPDDF